MKVVTALQMQKLDYETINTYGVPGVVLMENAGLRTVEAMIEHFNLQENLVSVFILCGKGNNGGDGFVIARHLHNAGHRVCICATAEPKAYKGDAAINVAIARSFGIPITVVSDSAALDAVASMVHRADILVDALFGTGLSSAPRGRYAELIHLINASGKPIVAVDIPSGLHPDSGKPYDPCVQAELTVTFALPKLGQLLYPGASRCGTLVVGDISFPRQVMDNPELNCEFLDDESILFPLLMRDAQSHKGTFGHLLAVGGSPGKTGALCLMGEAASRIGTGLVTLGVPRSLNPVIEMKVTEVMSYPLAQTKEGFLAKNAIRQILELSQARSALAIGPGLGQSDEIREVVLDLVKTSPVPMVIDADGLNVLAHCMERIAERTHPQLVLTPHPGEMARLLHCRTQDVQADRLLAAKQAASITKAVVVLKGARSIIASPKGSLAINGTGNPGMACGGMGDVLTGIIGGLLAQGFDAWEAACTGTYLHGLAGDVAAAEMSQCALTAGDLLQSLSKVFASLEQRRLESE